MEQPTSVPQTGAPIGTAAAAAITPDPELQQLLQRHSKKDPTLTPSEHGKVGAWTQKLRRIFPGSDKRPAAQSGVAGPQSGNAPHLGADTAGQAPDSVLPAVPVDPRLIQRTTNVCLECVSGYAVRKMANAARDVGATEQEATALAAKAAMPSDARKLAVDTSVDVVPEVFAWFGLSAKTYPILACAGAFGMWGLALSEAMDDFKAMKRAKDAAAAAKSPGSAENQK